MSRMDAIKAVARERGLSKRDVYSAYSRLDPLMERHYRCFEIEHVIIFRSG